MSYSTSLENAHPLNRFIECEECSTSGPNAATVVTGDEDAQRRAIAAWNTRAMTAQPTAGEDEVEAVAAAIYGATYPDCDGPPLDGEHPRTKQYYQRLARAALSAMNEVERARTAWFLAAAKIERDVRLHELTDDEERSLIRAAQSAMKGDGWRDIASAPKDGTGVILYGPGDNGVTFGHTWRGEWLDVWDGSRPFVPTHWQPLPTPPAPKE